MPGTAAYNIRTRDAVPDEVEVIPEGMRSRSASRLKEEDRPSTPGGTMIPKTVVELVEPDKPSHGEVPGTAAYDMRMADATPDVVLTSPIETRQNLEGEHISLGLAGHSLTRKGEPTSDHRSRFPSQSDGEPPSGREMNGTDDMNGTADGGSTAEDGLNGEAGEEDEEGFGDDFDDFEEGAEVGEDDFGDFDDGVQVAEATVPTEALQRAPDPLEHLVSSRTIINTHLAAFNARFGPMTYDMCSLI